MKFLIPLLLATAVAIADIKTYEGYKVFQVTPKNEIEARWLLDLKKTSPDYDFWTRLRKNGSSYIMVPPQVQNFFKAYLEVNHITYEIAIENLEPLLDKERQRQLTSARVPDGRISFDAYERYENIQSYLQELATDYPDLVTLETAAISTEGRDVSGIKISSGGNASKPIILIDAGIHAREWIAPAQALYVIQQLVENPLNRHLLTNVDWHIIPVLNPDGYEYTHTDERLWRKTRTPGTECDGVDGNRNFDYFWMEIGASDNECSEIFAGPYGFSEPETRGIRDWALRYYPRIKVYVTIHSYGNFILYPWGYTSELPADWFLLHNLGLEGARAIQAVAGTRYTVGSSTNVLYAAAGGSDDWVKAVGGVDVSYTFELPGGGNYGFDLPPERIQGVVEETWESFVVLHNYAQLQAV